jgi:hypothetical protein
LEAGSRASEGGQIKPGQAAAVPHYVDLTIAPPLTVKPHDRKRPSMRGHDNTCGAVQER